MKRLMKRVGMDNREKKVKREHSHPAYPSSNNNTRRRTSSSSSNQQQQGNNIRSDSNNNGNNSNNNIIQHEEHGIEVNIYTKKSIPNSEWKKAEHTFLNNHDEQQVTGKVLMACHVADFDQLNSNLDSSVAMAFEINNTSSRIIRAQIYFDQQHITNFIINPYTCEFIRNISNNGSAYPLFIKQHALAQDESEIDHNFLSVMGSIKIIIHEVKNYYETNETKEKVLERRFTCVKAGSLKSSSMSIDFGQPIPEENNARLVAQLTSEEPLVEFDIKYRNKTGYLLLLVQADKLPARGRNVPEVIEVSDDDIL